MTNRLESITYCGEALVSALGVVHILRYQPRGGGFQMLTVDYGGGGGGGGGGLVVDYVIKILIFYQFS